MTLLPFLVSYTKHHLQDKKSKGLADWMSEMSVTDGSQAGTWTGEHVLRSELLLNCDLMLYRKLGLCSDQATNIPNSSFNIYDFGFQAKYLIMESKGTICNLVKNKKSLNL